MPANSDSTNEGVKVTLTFTEQGRACLPPALVDALLQANLRVDIPASSTTGTTEVKASTLDDNIARIDSDGAIYVPGLTSVELTEQTVNLGTTTAPGTPVTMTFSVPGVSDLTTAINNITFVKEPPQSPVYIDAPRLNGTSILYDIYRLETGESAPYPEVVIRGSGRLFVVPSPSPT